MFRNTGANAFAKNQMRLAYEDKRDLYCSINFILVYKHLALTPPPPPTSVIQALEMPCTVWNNVTNNTSTTLVIYNNNQFPPLSTYPSIGLLSKDPIRSVALLSF